MLRLLYILGCLSFAAEAHDYITTKITWTREVSRIFFRNCTSCHREGGAAFSLVTFDEAKPWAKAIKEEVLMRRMPPWNAVKGFGEFKDDQGLTQEQIEIIAQWAEGGAPQGNPAYLPKTPGPGIAMSQAPHGKRMPVTGSQVLIAATTALGILPGTVPKSGAIQVVAERPDGRVDPLLWVQNFHPGYKRPYWFKRPLVFPAGTRIVVTPKVAQVVLLSRE